MEAARDDVFAGLASGRTGIVLTTPEFLSIHRDRFARSGRIGSVSYTHLQVYGRGHYPYARRQAGW